MTNRPVRTRFAPSPTGYLHIGGLRTALYAYAMAKKAGGKFILRIEDTDQKREVPGSKESIYQILQTFGLDWDEGPLVGGPHLPYVQSERVESGIYAKAAQKLLDEGHAYYCFCQAQTKEEIMAGREHKIEFRNPCRHLSSQEITQKLDSGLKPAIRLKTPDDETITYTDFVINKPTTWNTNFVDDAMLLKSDGFPTYHLAVVVDDTDMQISHVLRGHDWQPSTPIHLLIYKYQGLTPPEIGHPTDILNADGQGKLSKRKGNVSCEQFLADGYLPEALLNFVLLLGWAPKDNQDIFTLTDFIEKFETRGFQKSNPRMDISKLNWINGQHIRRKSDSELFEVLRPLYPEIVTDDLLIQIIPLVKDRIQKLSDAMPLSQFIWQAPTDYIETPNSEYVKLVHDTLEGVDWDKQSIETALMNAVTTANLPKPDFFMSMRLAVSGKKVTPPMTEAMLIIGKTEILARLKTCITM
jgi:glutamyl-tRNA synthetase